MAATARSYPARWLPGWHRYRRAAVVIAHLAFAALANYAAFWLRFDGDVPDRYLRVFLTALPAVLAARLIAFQYFRLHEGVWRYAGLWDLRNIVLATAASTAAIFAINRGLLGLVAYPRSVYITDAVLLVCLVGGARLTYRAVREVGGLRHARRVLIVGAGDAGAMVAREMRHDRQRWGTAVGFVDDDPGKRGLFIHGTRVLGSRADLPRLVRQTRADEVLIALPAAEPSTIREVVAALEAFDVPIKRVPAFGPVSSGRPSLGEIRPLALEDLLDRPPVGLRGEEVRDFVRGRRVLVTGAGGSIGSELCRQIASLEPAALVMLDRSENGLFAVLRELEGGVPPCVALIGDTTDRVRLEQIFARHRPEIVFHAAAHKHVPLMEDSPCEAVKNNVTGTRLTAEVAAAHGVEHFVLISSDKAVNPSSVMGATKRVCERLVLTLPPPGPTTFAAVRFGNVLGSNGSIVPLFTSQIRRGQPVTVTHPEMRRYFMLIPEAVQLVLHAASLARGGDLFVLEMGEQIKIVEMARSLIRLAGLRPGVDVPIVFTGARPGEKFHEELVEDGEQVEPAGREKILRIRPTEDTDHARLSGLVAELEAAARRGDDAAVFDLLRAIVPTFTPLAQPARDLTSVPG